MSHFKDELGIDEEKVIKTECNYIVEERVMQGKFTDTSNGEERHNEQKMKSKSCYSCAEEEKRGEETGRKNRREKRGERIPSAEEKTSVEESSKGD